MSSVKKSFALSLLGNHISIVIQLLSTLVIARLLTPEQIGIFSIAAVLSALAAQFRDFGLSEYLIQEKDLSASKMRSAFGANILVSWLMATLFFLVSWNVADFYGQPGIGSVMRVQAINFVIVPFGAITMAYFRREFNYKPRFISELSGNLVSFFVAVLGALAGLGYMSLAFSGLAGMVAVVTVSLAYRPSNLPRWPSFSGLREIFHFSKHAMGIYFFGQIGKSAPEVVIGRLLDMPSVAFFSRANGLIEIFNRSILRSALSVCLPYFAMEIRNGQRTSNGYLRATALITCIGWSFFAYISFIAYSIIRVLYGPQWTPSAPLAQILCLVAAIELPYWLATEVMIAAGRIDESHRLQFCLQGLRIAGLMLILPLGLPGACWGLAVAALSGTFLSHRFLQRVIGIDFSDVFRACAPSAKVSAVTALPSAIAFLFFEQTEANYLAVFVSCSAATGIMWLLSIRLFEHPIWHELSSLVRRTSPEART